MTPGAAPETPEEAAAGWAARRRSGLMTADEAAAFGAWLGADRAHREAFDHVQDVWRASAALRTDPQVMALRDTAMAAHPGRRRWAKGGAIAAALALALALAGGWAFFEPQPLPGGGWSLSRPQQMFSTGVGQTATVTLADGTVVTLDTDTRLRAREADGKRLVRLDRGQAFFKVAHDPAHPFVVSAGGKTITALGTAFNVRLTGQAVEVILTEGRVKVTGEPARRAPASAARDAPPQAPVAEMTPGSRLVADAGDDWRIAKVADVEEATSWRTGQLVFVRRPLGQVAQELNRYSEKKIIVQGDGLAAAPITGGFSAGDVDGFVEAVESYGLAAVTRDDDAAVILRPRKLASQ